MIRKQTTAIALFLSVAAASVASAQLTQPRSLQSSARRTSSLEEQLINGLRATRPEQKQFLRNIVKHVNQKRLDLRVVNAVFKWARNRQPNYPFPYFERGLRVESQKRGLVLVSVATIIRNGQVLPPPPLPN